jgi:hypothetical protein
MLPDGHPLGEPVIPNGLALCTLHHAAFDAYIIGVTPDLEVTVRLDVLQEIDGPMLQHGLQGSGDFLAERYALFRRARSAGPRGGRCSSWRTPSERTASESSARGGRPARSKNNMRRASMKRRRDDLRPEYDLARLNVS